MIRLLKYILLIVSFIYFSGCTTISLAGHAYVFKRHNNPPSNMSWLEDYPRETVWFNSGKNKLNGFIYGRENNKGLIIFSNGIHSQADDYGRIIRYLVDEGWRVFAYNGTGVGESEGFSMRGLSQSVIDLQSVMNYIEESKESNGFENLCVIIMGFSMGGYAAPVILNFDCSADAIISICSFNSIRDLFKYQGKKYLGISHHLIFHQTWLLQRIRFGDLATLTAVDGINKTHIPTLIMVNSDDEFIPPREIGIYAHKHEIINPYAEYIYLEGEDTNGHNFPRTHTFSMISEFLDNVLMNYNPNDAITKYTGEFQ